MKNRHYTYDGPVMVFDRVVCDHWHGSTYAPSPAKALSNLTYQYKKACNMLPGAKVSLTGTVVVEKDAVDIHEVSNGYGTGEQIPIGF